MTYSTFLTVQDIWTAAKDEAISSSQSTVTALQESQMLDFIRNVNTDFILAAHTRHHARGWSWLKKTSNFRTVRHTSLSAAISAGAATFALSDASNFDSSGRSVIETTRGALDFVDHSSKASNTLTVSTSSGAETVSMSHATDKVHKLYAVASDFGRVDRLWVNSLEYGYRKFMGRFPDLATFSMYGAYFFMPRSMYVADCTVLYEKAPSTISAVTSTTDIPREFSRYAIERTLAHIFKIKRKRDDMPTTMQLADIALENALLYDATQSTSNAINA